MTGKEIYKIWAPENVRWAAWAKPAAFAGIDGGHTANPVTDFIIPVISYIDGPLKNTAVILDLPGCAGIKEGLALVAFGFWPVPLYNGTNGQPGAMALIDNFEIASALKRSAPELAKLNITADAPPVFLLDSRRVNRYKMNVSVFDNSWDIYAQDLPSADYFIENKIDKIIVKGEKIQKDLNLILYGFQKKGIEVFFTKGYEKPKKTVIKKPFFY